MSVIIVCVYIERLILGATTFNSENGYCGGKCCTRPVKVKKWSNSAVSCHKLEVQRNLLVKIDFIVLSCSLGVQPTGSDRVKFFGCRFLPFLAQFQDGGHRTDMAQLTLFLWEICEFFFQFGFFIPWPLGTGFVRVPGGSVEVLGVIWPPFWLRMVLRI